MANGNRQRIDVSGTGQQLRFTPQATGQFQGPQIDYSQGFSPADAAATGGLLAGVPWLGVANLFADIGGAVFQLQQARAAEERAKRERRRQEGLASRTLRRQERQRRQELTEERGIEREGILFNRFQNLFQQRPAVVDKLARLAALRGGRQAAFQFGQTGGA